LDYIKEVNLDGQQGGKTKKKEINWFETSSKKAAGLDDVNEGKRALPKT